MPGHNSLIHFKICADRYMTRAYQVGTNLDMNRMATNMHQTKFGPMPIECRPGPIFLPTPDQIPQSTPDYHWVFDTENVRLVPCFIFCIPVYFCVGTSD